MSLKGYGLDAKAIEEWVPWGGLTRPCVMRQKDGSMFSVFRYKELNGKPNIHIDHRDFRRGWTVWIERQHTPENGSNDYLVVCWNPFITKDISRNPLKVQIEGRVINALQGGIHSTKALDYFVFEMKRLEEDLGRITDVKLLEYQELLDYVSFSVSLGHDHVELPYMPLYMDVYLTQNNTFDFRTNDIYINQDRLLICTLFGMPDMQPILETLRNVAYRHVCRMLFFDEKEASVDMKRYTSKWLSGRRTMSDIVIDDIMGAYNGYYNECLVFLLDSDNDEPFRDFLWNTLSDLEVSFIFESYNLKEVFWGSLPGLFLAGAHPPIIGFEHFEMMLMGARKKDEDDTSLLHIINSLSGKDAEGNVLDDSKLKYAGEDGEEITAENLKKQGDADV